MNENSVYNELVAYFGNQQKTADALQCRQPSVWKWVNGKACMSASLAIKAEKITSGKFKAYELCPSLYALRYEEVGSE